MIASFGRLQDCNASFFGLRLHYNALFFCRRHMAHYNLNARQKAAQKLKF